jgi:hypothetical protein
MTKLSRILSLYLIFCNGVHEPRMQNDDQSHAVASRHQGLFGEPSSKPTGKLIPQTADLAATSDHASSDERSANISSLDNVRIKSLRPAIIRGRMNDT